MKTSTKAAVLVVLLFVLCIASCHALLAAESAASLFMAEVPTGADMTAEVASKAMGAAIM